LSKYQPLSIDPTKPDDLEAPKWVDHNSQYFVRDEKEFTEEIRAEIQKWIDTDQLTQKVGNQNVPQTVDNIINIYCRKPNPNTPGEWYEYDKVRMLHLITPPVITQDLFRVRYISNRGKIETFEMDATSFYKDFIKCSLVAKGTTAGGALFAAAGIAGWSMALSEMLPIAPTAIAWVAGCCAITAGQIFSQKLFNTTISKHHSLVFTKGLERALKGESAPKIFLPVLAHMHFVQQLPADVRRNFEYGNNDPIDGSPFSGLLKSIDLMEFMVKHWENFETGCTNLATREVNSGDLANFREKNIDDGLIKPIFTHAHKLKNPLIRWQATWLTWTDATATISTFGLSNVLSWAAFKLEKLRGPWTIR